MPRATLRRSTFALTLLAGCATQGGEASTGPDADASTDPQTATAASAAEAGPHAPHVALKAEHALEDLHEVFLDPTGSAALTVDRGGKTHLWPRLLTADEVRPFELPIHEPQFLSLAKDGEGSFRLASIGASGGTVMASVTMDGDEATYTELIRLPPHDSALEVHIVDGGRRALWLGLDHTIRLYDLGEAVSEPAQAELSRVERTAFVPWQLRVSYGEDGTQTHAVAIIAGPTRAVPLTIGDTSIETGAESPALPLDRGPNRNDLALTPDGKRIVMLRRPGSKSKEVHLYVHELGTDGLRLLGGEVDVRWRGRMMLTGPTTAMIETGMGKGFSFDLNKAVPLETVNVVTRRNKQRPEPTIVSSTSTVLARHEPPPDSDFEGDVERYAGKRVHVDYRAGVRALPEGEVLIVDPLDSDTHFVHGSSRLDGWSVAFSDDGETIAVGDHDGVTALSRDTMKALGHHDLEDVRALAFLGDTTIAAYGRAAERLEVFECGQDGSKAIASLDVPVRWVPERAVFIRDDQGVTLLVRGGRPSDPRYAVALRDNTPGKIVTLKGNALDAVRPILEENLALDRAGRTYSVDLREQTYPRWSGDHDFHRVLMQRALDGSTAETPLRRGTDAELIPDPTGKLLVVRQSWTVSVYKTKDLSRVWTRGVGARGLAWSADGSELAVIGSKGLHVFGAEDGARRASKTVSAPLHEERKDDAFLK